MLPICSEIALFAFDVIPENWMHCDGRIMNINDNIVLFALLGNHFGGDGEYTFGIPDLRDREPKGMKYCIATKGMFPSRSENDT
jgi:microcystin-dependent protein